jgi:flavodoxin
MKKSAIGMLMLLCVSVCGVLYGEQGVVQKNDVLVVYYSRDGHTRLVAQKLAEKFGADIEALVDQKKRTGPAGNTDAGIDARAGKMTLLAPLIHKPDGYAVILIGTPGWFGNVTPAVRTFIKTHDLSGKKIGLFGTSHLTGIENALKQAAGLIDQENADTIPALALRHRDLPDEILSGKIDEFYREMMRR